MKFGRRKYGFLLTSASNACGSTTEITLTCNLSHARPGNEVVMGIGCTRPRHGASTTGITSTLSEETFVITL